MSGRTAGKVKAVCISDRKHVQKWEVPSVRLVPRLGIEGDAHAGFAHRQVSLLAEESVEKMRTRGLTDLKPGAFGENILTEGLDLSSLRVGDLLLVGKGALLQVSQVGKECVDRCAIYYAAGDCIMPREGIFARVLRGGEVTAGDTVRPVEREEIGLFLAGIITVSDRGSRGEREDLSGKVLEEMLEAQGFAVVERELVPDELDEVADALVRFADQLRVDLVLTTGGTGLSPRDVTPEATLRVIEKEVPGMAEAMRAASLPKTPHAMLSRAVCGIRGGTLIVNLPGSPRGARENLEVILPALPHGLSKLRGDTSECANPPLEGGPADLGKGPAGSS